MDIARREARKGAAEGTVVLADKQVAGRGRLGRAWLAPPGNIALSIILRPSAAHLPGLIMVASLAAVHTIEEVTGLRPQVKWPNDVLIQGKKVCGILVEGELRGGAVEHAIIGIGMNIKLDPSAYPEISATATSLSAELGREVSRLDVIDRLLVELERLYIAFKAGEPVYREWRSRLETLGRSVTVKWGDGVEQGVAESVDEDGGLLLRRSDGVLVRVVAGDVSLRS